MRRLPKPLHAPTDLALGPEGEWIYVLERRFTYLGGFAARFRRFARADLREGARVEAASLGTIETRPLAENYEGLATARDGSGRTVLYAISDDNFSALQRTLIVQFRVEE